MPAAAPDDSTQQQMDKLSATIQDMQTVLDAQNKRLDALEKKINDLSDKLGQSGGGSVAGADDLKKLAEQVQEIDKKRQDDNEAVLKELEKLDKALGVTPSNRKTTATTSTAGTNNATGGTPQKGYEYSIQEKDTLAAIAKAYRTQGVKVTTAQIIAANPGLNPNNLKVGQKIFIPDPNAK